MTTQTTFSDWSQPQILISILSMAVVSVAIPLLMHHLKYRRERAERIFEARKDAYQTYFKKFEKSAEDVGQEYDKFTNEILPAAFKKLLNSGSSPEALQEFQSTVGSFPHKIQQGYRSVLEEMTTLQIYASPTLLELIRKYESLHQEMMTQASSWLEEANKKLVAPNFDTPVAKEMKLRGEEIKKLKTIIINRMRLELGTDK
jgi:hypothetical protein